MQPWTYLGQHGLEVLHADNLGDPDIDIYVFVFVTCVDQRHFGRASAVRMKRLTTCTSTCNNSIAPIDVYTAHVFYLCAITVHAQIADVSVCE